MPSEAASLPHCTCCAHPLPPAALFLCQPTPSYVLSPKLAARLKSDVSSLKSNLRVYEFQTGNDIMKVKEQDCTPEVYIDSDLHDDQAAYYGHGQHHLIGILDMQRADLKQYRQYSSSVDLRDRLAHETIRGIFDPEEVAAESSEGADSWLLCNTIHGQHKIGRVSAAIDRSDDIATASVTLNYSVPMPGIDPVRTCPHVRLAAAGIESGPFTSVLESYYGTPASDQAKAAGELGEEKLLVGSLLDAMRRAMGLQYTLSFVDHARVLGERDPELEYDKAAEAFWVPGG